MHDNITGHVYIWDWCLMKKEDDGSGRFLAR